MDPDVTLARIRAAIVTYIKAQESEFPEAAETAASEAIAAMLSLDSWLSMGGFLPIPWQAKRNGLPESK